MWQVFFFTSRTTRDTNTVTFSPKHVKFPTVTSKYFLRQVAIDIISLLIKPPSLTTTIFSDGDTTRNALIQVSESLLGVQK